MQLSCEHGSPEPERAIVAAQLMKKLMDCFGQTAPVTVPDEACTATNKYLNGLCIFRKGSLIAGFADLKSGCDGIPEATKLAANIK